MKKYYRRWRLIRESRIYRKRERERRREAEWKEAEGERK